MSLVEKTRIFWIPALFSLAVLIVMITTGNFFIREDGVIVNAIGWGAIPITALGICINLGLLEIIRIRTGTSRVVAFIALATFLFWLYFFSGHHLIALANVLF